MTLQVRSNPQDWVSLFLCVSRLQIEWAGLPQLHPLSAGAGDNGQSLLSIGHGQDEVTVAEPATSSEVTRWNERKWCDEMSLERLQMRWDDVSWNSAKQSDSRSDQMRQTWTNEIWCHYVLQLLPSCLTEPLTQTKMAATSPLSLKAQKLKQNILMRVPPSCSCDSLWGAGPWYHICTHTDTVMRLTPHFKRQVTD